MPAGAIDSSRPKLVLLRPTDDAAAADVDGSDGCHDERIGVLDPPEPVCLPEVGVDLREFRREQARHRCTMLLRCLGGAAISTALIGAVPGDAPGLGLHRSLRAARARAPGADRLRQGDRGRTGPPPYPPRRRARSARGSRAPDPAMAGFPGAWDEDGFEEPRAVHAEGRSAGVGPTGPAPPGPLAAPDYPGRRGGVAELVERYVRNVEAEGSSPFTSTRHFPEKSGCF